MELNEKADIDTSQIDDRRGASGGGGLGGLGGLGSGGGIPIPIPSGKGGLIVTLVVVGLMLLGGGYFGSNLIGGGEGGGDNTNLNEECASTNPDRLNQTECRDALYVNSIQHYWQGALPQTFGSEYQVARTVYFSQAVSTGCGQADSGVGPFYCPADHHVYIDLTFWDELASRFGAKGQFAQPYVLAHEYGHHVQSLLGTEAQMRRAQERDPDNANRYSVMLELQADCYAGVWAKHAGTTKDQDGDAIFTSITQTDINEALEAAAAVGDDAIQRKQGGPVDQAEFTHGSSAQRQEWFNRGFRGGDGKQCDTFGNAL